MYGIVNNGVNLVCSIAMPLSTERPPQHHTTGTDIWNNCCMFKIQTILRSDNCSVVPMQ